MQMPHVENNQIAESATEARAARPGRPVLYVLLASTAGVIVLFAVVYFVLFATH
jgi:hypothetical protein